MRIRRTFPLILVVLAIAAALTLAVQLRKHAPPEAARLLPGADGFFYLDFRMARKASGGELPAVIHDPEYQRFIEATGFEFERDLEAAAFAVHYPAAWPGGGTGGAAHEPCFSEVFVGKFQGQRLTAYLRQIAKSVENYHSVDIFTIPIEGRTLRTAVLSADSLAASNHPDPAVIEGIIDHSQRLASPFGGPALLRQYYKHVQLASLAWVVARIDPSAPDTGMLSGVLSKAATLVVSGSALNPLHLHSQEVHLRAEAFAQSSEDAQALADKINVFLAMMHSAESSVGTHGTDADVKALFDSLKVKQESERVVVTAAMSAAFLHKLLAEPTAPVAEPEPAPAPSAVKPR